MFDKLDSIIFGFTQAIPLNAHGALLAFHSYSGPSDLPYVNLGQLSCGALIGSIVFWILHKGQNIFGPKRINFLPFFLSSFFPLGIAIAWALPRWMIGPAPIALLIVGHVIGLMATIALLKKFPKKEWDATAGNGLALGLMQSLLAIPGCDRQALAMLYFRFFGHDLKKSLLFSLWSLFPLLAISSIWSLYHYRPPPLEIFLSNVLGAGLASYFALDIFWRLSEKTALLIMIIARLAILGFALRYA